MVRPPCSPLLAIGPQGDSAPRAADRLSTRQRLALRATCPQTAAALKRAGAGGHLVAFAKFGPSSEQQASPGGRPAICPPPKGPTVTQNLRQAKGRQYSPPRASRQHILLPNPNQTPPVVLALRPQSDHRSCRPAKRPLPRPKARHRPQVDRQPAQMAVAAARHSDFARFRSSHSPAAEQVPRTEHYVSKVRNLVAGVVGMGWVWAGQAM